MTSFADSGPGRAVGWGASPHEGWPDRRAPDGRWLGATTRGGDPDPVACQAACECGWRCEWSWRDGAPTAHVALGLPEPARAAGVEPPIVSIELPERAILRWPA
jgi:hypothetical protein